MDSNVDQASFQPLIQANNDESLSKSHGFDIEPETRIPQSIYKLNQLKSFEILRSALTIFTTNFKLMFLMILSVVSLFAVMIFFEIKLQTVIKGFPNIFEKPYKPILISSLNSVEYGRDQEDDIVDLQKNFFYNLVQVCVFYMVLYPVLEIFSVVVTVKYAASLQSGDNTQMSLKGTLYKNNFMAVLVTYLSVHLLSGLTLVGLIWAVLNHQLLSHTFWHPFLYYEFQSFESFCFNLLSVGFHSAVSIALIYVYLGWSAFWNMSIVISILEEETGFGAFGLSHYYGKHCKKTGFQLMVVFFAFGNFLRVPSLFFGLCKSNFAGVLLIAIVIGFVCFGNLVKWIAFVLYFYDCKQQVLEKKGDEEVAKSVKKDDNAC